MSSSNQLYLRQQVLDFGISSVAITGGGSTTSDLVNINGMNQIDFFVYVSAATTLTFTFQVSHLQDGSELYQTTNGAVAGAVTTLTAGTYSFVASTATRINFGLQNLNAATCKLIVASSGNATVTVKAFGAAI